MSAAAPPDEQPGTDHRAAKIGDGKPECGDRGQPAPDERVEHDDAFAAVDGRQREQRRPRIGVSAARAEQADSSDDLAHRDHAREQRRRLATGRRADRARQQPRLDQKQRPERDSRRATRGGTALERRVIALGEPARLKQTRETEGDAARSSDPGGV
ncbi:MAG TPA: hypothetical protein VFZ00_13790 [Solirubrobacter sp.]|nr:hypothetical protein [Solirubrobacter sp.]